MSIKMGAIIKKYLAKTPSYLKLFFYHFLCGFAKEYRHSDFTSLFFPFGVKVRDNLRGVVIAGTHH